MATPVILPRQGQSVESCLIGEWKKKVGDTVKVGDILFSYETDKSTFEEEAKIEGTLLAIFFEEGDDVPCLTNVAVIGNPGESFTEFDPNNQSQLEAEAKTEEPAKETESVSLPKVADISTQDNSASAVGVSPRARASAEAMKVDISLASPSGPKGRVIERDIIRLAQEIKTGSGIGGRFNPDKDANYDVSVQEGKTVPNSITEEIEFEDIKLTNIRKVIGKNMHQSLSGMAQLTHNITFDATEIMNYRKALKTSAEKLGLPNITLNDIILYAVSRVLINHNDLNAHLFEDKIRHFKHVHLGVAVDTPRGLMVPTLFNADTKSLSQISREAKIIAKSAQEGNISPDFLTGGTFTVSNLGMFGIESFTPVINPPQTGILGINGIIERVRNVNGQITTYPAMGLSLTYDHRALDGAPASKFLMDLKNALENFSVLLAG